MKGSACLTCSPHEPSHLWSYQRCSHSLLYGILSSLHFGLSTSGLLPCLLHGCVKHAPADRGPAVLPEALPTTHRPLSTVVTPANIGSLEGGPALQEIFVRCRRRTSSVHKGHLHCTLQSSRDLQSAQTSSCAGQQ